MKTTTEETFHNYPIMTDKERIPYKIYLEDMLKQSIYFIDLLYLSVKFLITLYLDI